MSRGGTSSPAGSSERAHHGCLERRGRTDAFTLRHGRLDEHAGAGRECQSALACEHQPRTGHVRRPVPVRVGGKPGACHVVGHRRYPGGERIQRHIADPRRTCVRQAHDPQRTRRIRLHGGKRGLTNRPLQHERAGVVGDAAHHVEATWRPRDHDVPARFEQPARRLERMVVERLEAGDEAGSVRAFAHRGHVKPRAQSLRPVPRPWPPAALGRRPCAGADEARSPERGARVRRLTAAPSA